MLEAVKREVCAANLKLVELGLVLFTWGNVSAMDKESGLVVIKPSGVSYGGMTADDMVVVDLDGSVVEGQYRPSSDTPTHIELYKAFGCGAVVHTHSKWATVWSQAKRPLPCLGTTHADNFYGEVPITRSMTEAEIGGEYERDTGKVIIEAFAERDPTAVQAVLVANHGPFAWGGTAEKAVENAAVLEYCCEMAYYSLSLSPDAAIPRALLDKHYLRKHGTGAYYGQK